ncbi:hypothetical protein BDFB_015227 [Asbolus verrucosus]|nr:hypothetical protein BDFB_015227 [Asbolus verrucosus]
MKKSGRQ